MKKLVSFLLALVCVASASAQSMKMVVDSKGEVVGRFVKDNGATYTISVQDDCDVPADGLRVVTFSAARGQGTIFRDQRRTGNINVRKRPTTASAVIAKIQDTVALGTVPDCFDCLGLVNGWYKLSIDGKVGYVRQDLMQWDGMCTF